MAEKRKDSKGRILRDGENQMKDGRYRYSTWTAEESGVRCIVGNWWKRTERRPERGTI